MLINKCPGQDKRNIKIETLSCYNCGYLIEIFSDEIKLKCPSCGIWTARERLSACVDWCASARQCIGEGKWLQLKRDLPSEIKGDKVNTRVYNIQKWISP
ncbi:MAG: hypothetical protein ABSE81_02295 [Candidatus Omnitrophota bacterium]|jgi:predicted RNA-binding Zn-ribbon protein involved in translation (DUF1610 family)